MQTLEGNFDKVNNSVKELNQVFSDMTVVNQKDYDLKKEEVIRLYVLYNTQKEDIKG